jgi:hypothetical protein
MSSGVSEKDTLSSPAIICQSTKRAVTYQGKTLDLVTLLGSGGTERLSEQVLCMDCRIKSGNDD